MFWYADLKRRIVHGGHPIVFDVGGKRLALDPGGTLCVSAAYDRYGVAAYAVPEGRELWRRPDVKKVQNVIWDDLHGTCVLVRDQASAEVVDPADGRTIDKVPRVKEWYPSAYEPLALCEYRDLRVLELPSRRCRFSVQRESFATLAACFSRDAVFVSESGGPLRAFGIADGLPLWRLVRPGQHYLSLGFCESTGQLYGVRWEFTKGTEIALDRIMPDSGTVIGSWPLSAGSVIGAFACGATLYIGGDCNVTNCVTGETFTLSFPHQEGSVDSDGH